MLKIITIIGARPQIIKAAALSRAIRFIYPDRIQEILVHTGQHYDEKMSNVFFEELSIPKPNYNLEVGSGSHGVQTAKMIEGIEQILLSEKPNYIVLYGDTNSTLAGAVAAGKLHVPIVHIEAGLRSFNKRMPEEINRILTDHCATFLFPPTKTGINNLIAEGFNENSKAPFSIDNPKVLNVGDVMLDNSLYFAQIAIEKSAILKNLELENEPFVLCTIHRNDNTDDPERLSQIFEQLNNLAGNERLKIIVPMHPRTRKNIDALDVELVSKINKNQHLIIIDPVSFLDIILLEKNASLIITDSGGVQKEAYFFGRPCLIVRQETEWVEIVEAGMAKLVQPNQIFNAAKDYLGKPSNTSVLSIFGDGKAAEKILEELLIAYGQ
jgi:UDP-GlcNAc3NAcA epimerase